MTQKLIKLTHTHEREPTGDPQASRIIPGVGNSLTGSKNVSSAMVVLAPNGIGKAHLHEKAESAVFIIEGYLALLEGPDLRQVIVGPGDFIFIPAGVEHAAINLSSEHRVLLVETRTELNFNHDTVSLPELDPKVAGLADGLRDKFNTGQLGLGEDWQQLLGSPINFMRSALQKS